MTPVKPTQKVTAKKAAVKKPTVKKARPVENLDETLTSESPAKRGRPPAAHKPLSDEEKELKKILDEKKNLLERQKKLTELLNESKEERRELNKSRADCRRQITNIRPLMREALKAFSDGLRDNNEIEVKTNIEVMLHQVGDLAKAMREYVEKNKNLTEK